MSEINAWLVLAIAMIAAGLAIALFSWWKILRRWFVLRVRMPLMRRLRFRPSRGKADHYVIE